MTVRSLTVDAGGSLGHRVKQWWRGGDPWIWLNASALTATLLIMLGLLGMIGANALRYFWPADVISATYAMPDQTAIPLYGQIVSREEVATERLISAGIPVDPANDAYERWLLKVGNRDISGADFRYEMAIWMQGVQTPRDLAVIERREWGNLYGKVISVSEGGSLVAEGEGAWGAFESAVARANDIYQRIHEIEKGDLGAINYELNELRLSERKLDLARKASDGAVSAEVVAEDAAARNDIASRKAELQKQYEKYQQQLTTLYTEIRRDSYRLMVAGGETRSFPIEKVVLAYRPNELSLMGKLKFFAHKLWEFTSDEPREANTEGGIFPAIFGTVVMVLLMSVFVTPFGVIAALYLREYAKQGTATRVVRIAVNNLAGVPSIVFGVFGLGFFVYTIGGSIDDIFFPEALPSPTFGTPGLLWSSLTLALLTLPVVIVATEEGLARIPRALREASLALGATKAETLWRVVIPMASPAIMTGLILAIARAAGEVAPLMLVGVVKLAPSLPLDFNAPFIHLDRKFMHLGFHIYDVGFQSPNVEAARPLVYATAFLLVLVIVALNLTAVQIRNRLRERYKALEH